MSNRVKYLRLAKVYAQMALTPDEVRTSASDPEPPIPEEDRDAPPSVDPLGDVLGFVTPVVGLPNS